MSGASAELDQVSARLEQQKRELSRTERLWKNGAISAQEREVSALEVEVLKASQQSTQVRLREAHRMATESVLRAPFDGTVVAVYREQGERVAPGARVLELSGNHRLEIEIDVPEQTLAHLAPDSDVRVDFPLIGKRNHEGTVRQIGVAASETGRLFPVIIDVIPAAGLRPGVTAEVVLDLGADHSLSVPVAAVRDPSGTAPSVIRVRGDRAEIVGVSVRELLDDRVIVRAPLAIGHRVVIAGHAFLLDGDRVQVTP